MTLPDAELSWRDEIARRDLHRHADALRNHAEKLRTGADYPTDTPPLLCELIEVVATAIRDHLPSAPTSILTHVSKALTQATTQLRYVERSKVADTPWSMIEATEAFLTRHAGTDHHFIIRPQWGHNYHTDGDFVTFYQKELGSLRTDTGELWLPANVLDPFRDKKIYCLSFPRLERLNVLLHANWGHELGHLIARKWIDAKFDELWAAHEPSVRDRLKADVVAASPRKASNELFYDVEVNARVADLTKVVLSLLRIGLIELLADTVGAHVFGPASLAAASEFAVRAISLDQSPLGAECYPPWRYRLVLIHSVVASDVSDLRQSAEATFMLPFLDWIDRTRSALEATARDEILQLDSRTKLAYEIIGQTWETVRVDAIALLPKESTPYRLSERLGSLRQLVHRLQGEVPPNQVGDPTDGSPADLADILNAGWIEKRNRLKDGFQNHDLDVLNRLVLKGIELSQIQMAYGPDVRAAEAT